MMVKGVGEEEGKTIGRKRANEKITSYLHHSQLETRTNPHTKEQACSNEAWGFDLFIFWEEGGGKKKHFRAAEYFSLPWVGIKNILISLFTQNVPCFQWEILVFVCSPLQECPPALGPCTSLVEAGSPWCPDLTLPLNKIPTRVCLPVANNSIEVRSPSL